MFNSDILDVVIGLTFLYLVLSLICTALTEIIESVLKKRASELESGIRMLLSSPQKAKNITDYAEKIYNHPLIKGLYDGNYNSNHTFIQTINLLDPNNKRNLPSYIPTRIFTLALMDELLYYTKERDTNAPKSTLKEFRDAILKIDNNDDVKNALLALVDAAGDNIDQAQKNIEIWYDSGMERVSSWYKRHTQKILIILGLLVAIALNADTIAIVTNLARNGALRDAVVASAQVWAKDQPSQDINNPFENLETELNAVKNLGLPIGWDANNPTIVPPTNVKDTNQPNVFPWLLKLLGWFITAGAISLGSPFWFDLLNKFMVFRTAIKPKSPEE
jgi:hypothetical protein